MGRYSEAEQYFIQCIQQAPSYAEAHCNLGTIYQSINKFSEAVASYRAALRLKPNFYGAYSNLLFCLNYIKGLPAQYLLDEAKAFGSLVSSQARPKYGRWDAIKPRSILRVGFVSGDFKNHPVGYFLESFIGDIERNDIKLYAYSTQPTRDEHTDRIQRHFDVWRPVFGLSDKVAAELIHSDNIDVLIDLSGHTAHNRLAIFSYKPAPVQATWLGYFATTGLPEMDYIIGDPYLLPQPESIHFTERPWQLPSSWFCMTPPSLIELQQLPALNAGHVTFGCFGNLSKVNDDVLDTWGKILIRAPTTKLFLKSNQLKDSTVVSDLISRFSQRGIDESRLILEGPSPRSNYLLAYKKVDLVLDTFPYPGGTTSVEAISMGVPVLTLRGDRFLAHLGESIVANTGLSELVATDIEDYVSKAFSYTSNLTNLQQLRETLRHKLASTPLFNTKQFASDIKAAFYAMSNGISH